MATSLYCVVNKYLYLHVLYMHLISTNQLLVLVYCVHVDVHPNALFPVFFLSAAVTSMAKFGAACDDLLPSIIILLERLVTIATTLWLCWVLISCLYCCRCLLDSDDEVRDRALLYIEVLKQKQKALSSAYILNRMSISVCMYICLSASSLLGHVWHTTHVVQHYFSVSLY